MVEPTCERQRVGRVETMVTLSRDLWSVLLSVAGGFDSAVRVSLMCWLNRLRKDFERGGR